MVPMSQAMVGETLNRHLHGLLYSCIQSGNCRTVKLETIVATMQQHEVVLGDLEQTVTTKDGDLSIL